MGSAASVLPDKISEADAIRLCGDKYDAQKFNALKDSSGFISKDFFRCFF